MKKTLLVLSIAALALGVFAAPPAKPGNKPPVKKVTCPVCHMELATKKSKANPVAIQFKKGGPIYYCCDACKAKMDKKIIVQPKKPTTPPKKGK